MPISYRPEGEAAAVGTAGELVGKSEARKESRRQAERQQEISLREAAQNRAYQWEAEKMLLNSQQDFAHEQRMRQVELDREARAHEWETEKMELASRFDFEQNEKERLRKKAEYSAGYDVIENSQMTDEEKARAHFRHGSKYLNDVPEAAKDVGLSSRTDEALSVAERAWNLLTPEEQSQAAKIQAGLSPRAGSKSAAQETLARLLGEQGAPVAQAGQVYVKSPTGVRGVIPAEQLEEAMANGYTLVEGQNIPKSEAYKKAMNQWLVEEKFPQLSQLTTGSLFATTPWGYIEAKGEQERLAREYPEARKQYLENIKKKWLESK